MEDYTSKRTITLCLGQERIQMPILIASIVPNMIMIGLSQGISTINISTTGEDLSIMANSALRTSKRR